MNNKQLLLPLGCALLLISGSSLHARHRIYVNDPLIDTGWIDSMVAAHQEMMDSYNNTLSALTGSKEDRDAIKQAREKLAKITYEIKEEDTSIRISLKGFEGLAKDDVKVIEKDTGWYGTINLKDGRIEFFLSPFGFQLSSRIDLTRDETVDKGPKDAADKKDATDKTVKRTFYSSSSSAQAEFFKTAVDLKTLKAEPVKADELVLVIQKQKEKLLPIS